MGEVFRMVVPYLKRNDGLALIKTSQYWQRLKHYFAPLLPLMEEVSYNRLSQMCKDFPWCVPDVLVGLDTSRAFSCYLSSTFNFRGWFYFVDLKCYLADLKCLQSTFFRGPVEQDVEQDDSLSKHTLELQCFVSRTTAYEGEPNQTFLKTVPIPSKGSFHLVMQPVVAEIFSWLAPTIEQDAFTRRIALPKRQVQLQIQMQQAMASVSSILVPYLPRHDGFSLTKTSHFWYKYSGLFLPVVDKIDYNRLVLLVAKFPWQIPDRLKHLPMSDVFRVPRSPNFSISISAQHVNGNVEEKLEKFRICAYVYPSIPWMDLTCIPQMKVFGIPISGRFHVVVPPVMSDVFSWIIETMDNNDANNTRNAVTNNTNNDTDNASKKRRIE